MTRTAFGAPGIDPTWSSSDKDFVTTALGSSRLWVTVGHGIVNEVYWPSTGTPQIRDFGFYLIGAGRWIDLKRVQNYRLSMAGPYLPALTITHHGDDYELTLEILPDPRRDVLLVRYRLEGPYAVAVILAPHLQSTGRTNHAWVEQGRGYARRGSAALCLAADIALSHLSCGYTGWSDGWQDLNQHGALTYDFDRADAGNIALSAQAQETRGVFGLGFATTPSGAHTLVRSALAEGFDILREQFLEGWGRWGRRLQLPQPAPDLGSAGTLAATILKIHEDRSYPGAVVASLSVPWGNSSNTLGGYHLVWPRDTTLSAFALLGANQLSDVRRLLGHLTTIQLPEGNWPQNYFPSGEAFWSGIQLDEAGFPVLLAAKMDELHMEESLGTADMVRAAVRFIVRAGPSSQQDRWEENSGFNPFTLAVAVSALIAAAPWLTAAEADYAASLANYWNERIESWCYVEDTALARRCGVSGYYVRIAPSGHPADRQERVQLQNRQGETIAAAELVSMDFSYLVRLGLRAADDSRVINTIKVVDQILRVQTPSGDLYHRYNEDGYGEHADGSAFDGSGIGRGWPLLVGERGHLALQAGEDCLAYLKTMWNCASAGGLLPEQVWDTEAIPARGLFPGRPSGSAMPLLWTHAEFLKLLLAREQGRPLELLRAVEGHFLNAERCRVSACHWRDSAPAPQVAPGTPLLIEDTVPFTLHLGFDGWQDVEERDAVLGPFAIWSVAMNAAELSGRHSVNFTRRYADHWEGTDHCVLV